MLLPKSPFTSSPARPRQREGARGEASTQVYRWPVRLERINRWTPPLAVLAILGGIALFLSSAGVEGLERPTGGILLATAGVAGLAMLGILHLCLVRSMCFTRDRVVIRQALREPVELAYCQYHRDWVVDGTNPRALRLLLFRHNRGCSVWHPPDWVRDAFEEIARIHREEGWYEPEDQPGREPTQQQ